MRRLILFVIVMLCYGASEAKEFVPNARLIGEGSRYFIFFHVYDVGLYADGDFSFDKPFYLTFTYKRDLESSDIYERSAEAIEGLGFEDEATLDDWEAQMKNIFPDVTDGTEITSIYEPDGATVFYQGEEQIGTIEDSEFGRWYFGIWLNEKTSLPDLRKELLGIN